MQNFFLLLLLSLNTIAFGLYGLDKAKAKLDAWRISEKILLLWSLLGGIGSRVGMKVFRHKTLKPKFKAATTVGMLLHIFLFALVLMN